MKRETKKGPGQAPGPFSCAISAGDRKNPQKKEGGLEEFLPPTFSFSLGFYSAGATSTFFFGLNHSTM
jgi:hypothetical protein